MSLTIIDVEWTDVLNKPAFFSGSYNDLTDTPSVEDLTNPQGQQGELGFNGASERSDISNKPTWVTTSKGGVNLSGFYNNLSLAVGDMEKTDESNKHAFFSGSYNDLTETLSVEDLTGPQGPQGEPGLNGASEWFSIFNKLTWVATSQGASTCWGSTTTSPWRWLARSGRAC
jgi:hypothetical protein